MSYFFTETFTIDPEASKKVMTPEGLQNLRALRADLASATAFDCASLEARFKALATANGIKVGAYIHPVRLATSGRSVGPSLYHLLEVLGKDRVLARIDRALA